METLVERPRRMADNPTYRRHARDQRRSNSRRQTRQLVSPGLAGDLPQNAESLRTSRAVATENERSVSRLGLFFADFSFEKALTSFAFLSGIAVIAFCLADLIVGWPMMKATPTANVLLLLAGGLLLVATYEVFRDQTRHISRYRKTRKRT